MFLSCAFPLLRNEGITARNAGRLVKACAQRLSGNAENLSILDIYMFKMDISSILSGSGLRHCEEENRDGEIDSIQNE
jgi:hypothetical protein